ncbi:unnamed protein product [marine sediment metagenome]|uniref:Peptidase C39 domain-containing protein n=1 Tax=marine sediment metagenome TaxID=412755 RepID=X1AAE8_9ZZZZ
MIINLIKQPDNSNLCGQACVAMIAGISLDESIKLFNSRGTTTTKNIYYALWKRGISCSDKAVRIKNDNKPELCIVLIHCTGCKNTHWCIWNNNKYYDPVRGIRRKLDIDQRETSFIRINQ